MVKNKYTLNILLSFAVDRVPPVVECVPDVSETTPLGSPGRTVTYVEPTATDNSGFAHLLSSSHVPGSFFLVGCTEVTYTFVDGSNNGAVCIFTVTVIEGMLVRAPFKGIGNYVDVG